MQFEVNGKKFSISFFYDNVEQQVKHNGKMEKFDCKQTTCKIDNLVENCKNTDGTFGSAWRNVGKAHTVCSPFDQFIKDIGRKEALKRTLSACGFNKQIRTKIWQEYRNRNKKSGMVESN